MLDLCGYCHHKSQFAIINTGVSKQAEEDFSVIWALNSKGQRARKLVDPFED